MINPSLAVVRYYKHLFGIIEVSIAPPVEEKNRNDLLGAKTHFVVIIIVEENDIYLW